MAVSAVIRTLLWLLALFCFAALPQAHAETEAPSELLPEVVAASKLAEMTGIALNPLVVGGAMRAWQYSQTPEAARGQLHWTSQPWFWGSLLGVGLLFLLNNTIGRLIPPTAHAMDVVESVEGKLAPLYTSPLLIPVGVQLVAALDQAGFGLISSAVADNGSYWTDPLTVALGSMVAVFITLIVWLSNQAVHTIVLLAPFALISWLVRLLQWSLLGVLLLATLIHPVLGALVSLLIIVVCLWIAGWSFRLTVFGMVFSWDWCRFKTQQNPAPQTLAFSGSALKLPVRTLGYLQPQGPQLRFSYRPWLVLPRRQLLIDAQDRCLQHGVWYSRLQTAKGQVLLSFPPRYRDSEQQLADLMACTNVQASPLKQSLQAAWAWLRGV